MQTFTKTRPDAPAGFFEVEAAGLRWLAAANAVRVPAVLEVRPGSLTIERFRPVVPVRGDAVAFGAALAALHDAGAPAFGSAPAGWTGDGFIGDAALPLRTEPSWGRFYARHRIAPYLADAGLASDGRAILDALCGRLEDGDFDDPAPPARIHGDLWSGNVLFTAEGVSLIDPAAHGGHRITDLAMLSLFGCAHLEAILGSYADASHHLPENWRELVPLHQVHPLLVHAVLFGGGYGGRAVRAAAEALALLTRG